MFGVITACFGAGALLGALASASIARASPKLLLAGTGCFGLAELALAPQHSLAAVGPLLFLTGLAFTMWTSNANSTLQLSTPDRMRGRVMGRSRWHHVRPRHPTGRGARWCGSARMAGPQSAQADFVPFQP